MLNRLSIKGCLIPSLFVALISLTSCCRQQCEAPCSSPCAPCAVVPYEPCQPSPVAYPCPQPCQEPAYQFSCTEPMYPEVAFSNQDQYESTPVTHNYFQAELTQQAPNEVCEQTVCGHCFILPAPTEMTDNVQTETVQEECTESHISQN